MREQDAGAVAGSFAGAGVRAAADTWAAPRRERPPARIPPVAPRGPGAAAPRPYNRVITSEAKTRRGMFVTHQVGDKLYFEIPCEELDKDMLLVGRYARAAAATRRSRAASSASTAATSSPRRRCGWDRQGNKVILRSPSFAITADTGLSVYRAVQAAELSARSSRCSTSRPTVATAPPWWT